MSEVSRIGKEAELIVVVDSSALDGYLSMKQGVGINDLMQWYNSEDRTVQFEANVNDAESAERCIAIPALQSLSQAASDALDVTEDVALREALRIAEERIGTLRDSPKV